MRYSCEMNKSHDKGHFIVKLYSCSMVTANVQIWFKFVYFCKILKKICKKRHSDLNIISFLRVYAGVNTLSTSQGNCSQVKKLPATRCYKFKGLLYKILRMPRLLTSLSVALLRWLGGGGVP